MFHFAGNDRILPSYVMHVFKLSNELRSVQEAGKAKKSSQSLSGACQGIRPRPAGRQPVSSRLCLVPPEANSMKPCLDTMLLALNCIASTSIPTGRPQLILMAVRQCFHMQILVHSLAPRIALLHLSQTLRSVLMMTTALNCKTAPPQPSPQPQAAGCQQAGDRAPARTWHHLKLRLQEALHLAIQDHQVGAMSAKALLLGTQVPPATMTQASGRQHLT